jgi:hypothetical protein
MLEIASFSSFARCEPTMRDSFLERVVWKGTDIGCPLEEP